MYVSAIVATGFRNIEGRFPLASPLAVVLGENNAGKSNLVDAIRLLFEPEAGPQSRRWITEQDFRHDGRGTRVIDAFELEAELAGLSVDEQARMVTCLSPSLGAGRARIRLRARRRADGRVDHDWLGGDSAHADIERWAREAVSFTYLHPLRDATADLRPGRENRLVGLLTAIAPEGNPDRGLIEGIAATANEALGHVDAVSSARDRIQDRVRTMAGGGSFAQSTNLVFADPRFDRIVGTLRAMAGALEPLELAENGLGYNNLLYMAVLLSGLSAKVDRPLHLLLVEEPEAHLHPQLQDLLMRHLEEQGGDNTQVVVTTHSPNFASSARVDRATVVASATAGAPTTAFAPAEFGVPEKHLRHLRRFLDVTKASLLFARGVILVEGIAEQLLLPVIARRLDRPLPTAGVSVISIGGVAFQPFVGLFGAGRLPYRCALVSDGDPPRKPTAEEIEGGDPLLSPLAAALLTLDGDNVRVCLSTKTLEWDLVAAGNWDLLLAALTRVKPRVAKRLQEDDALIGASLEVKADALLAAVDDVKGQFAQELADLLDAEPNRDFVVPEYIRVAIEWVTDRRGG